MKVFVRTSVFAACLAMAGGAALAQARAESALVGIRLYDTGVTVVKKFGSPTEVQAVVWNTQTGGGGPGAGPGGSSGGGGFAAPPGGAGAGAGSSDFVVPPAGWDQRRPTPSIGGGETPPSGGGGGEGAYGGSGGTTGTTQSQYVRWIYRRGPASSVNFVLNKFNKVVQIEAIGISNPRVRTSRGITLGSTLADVIRKYQNPDGYDVGGDYFMVRFLQRSKVGFRFTREHARAPYRVTGIVVSAGKA